MKRRSIILLLYVISCTLPEVLLAQSAAGEWNEWSGCTKACGMGTRRRTKRCPNGEEDCQIQIKMCNLHKCDDESSTKKKDENKANENTVKKVVVSKGFKDSPKEEIDGKAEKKIVPGPAGIKDSPLQRNSIRRMMTKTITKKIKSTDAPKTTKRKSTTKERKMTTKDKKVTPKEEITVRVNDVRHKNVFDNDEVKVRFVETEVSDEDKTIQSESGVRNVETVWENMASYDQKLNQGGSGIKLVTYPPRTKKQTTENQDDPNRHVFYSDSSGGGIFKKKKGLSKKNATECKDHGKCRDYYYQRHTWCRYHPWIIHNCKVMCQNCPVPELEKKQEPVACVDHNHCPNYVFQGHVWCRMHAWIKANCRAMCGTCPPPPCTRLDHVTCMDQAENKFYYCQTAWTQNNCPRMCGRCNTPECVVPDHPSCTMYQNRPEYYCKHLWLRQNCANTCGHCYKRGPNWPAGEYAILSREKCPPFWYEFNHCIDTENDHNRDRFDRFTVHSDYKCDKTSLTFRYCFRGPNVPTTTNGFWTRGGPRSSLYVIKNNRGKCEKFGRDGGTIQINDEREYNRNEYGSDYSEDFQLNGHRYSDYSPAGFIYGPYARTRLSFCEVGYNSPDKTSNHVLNVGAFGWQKFGFFINPDGRCPTIKSPYGFLIGKKANFFMDNENSYNRNRVISGQPPVYIGTDSSWAVCEYDPYSPRNT